MSKDNSFSQYKRKYDSLKNKARENYILKPSASNSEVSSKNNCPSNFGDSIIENDEGDDMGDTGEGVQQDKQKNKISSISIKPSNFQKYSAPNQDENSRCVTEPDEKFMNRSNLKYDYFMNKNFPIEQPKMSFQGNPMMGSFQMPYPTFGSFASTQYNSNSNVFGIGYPGYYQSNNDDLFLGDYDENSNEM